MLDVWYETLEQFKDACETCAAYLRSKNCKDFAGNMPEAYDAGRLLQSGKFAMLKTGAVAARGYFSPEEKAYQSEASKLKGTDMNKTQSIANLSALLAVHYGTFPHIAAECAVKLTNLANAIVQNEEWSCNGYKNDAQDEYMSKLSREGKTQEANAYRDKLQTEGAAAYEADKEKHGKRLAKILQEYKLPADCVQVIGLYGGLQLVYSLKDDTRAFVIAAK